MTTQMIDGSAPAVKAEGDWLKLSAEMTDAVDLLTASPGKLGKLKAGRRDIVVTIAPGAGHGHKACFAHNLGRIEIDGPCWRSRRAASSRRGTGATATGSARRGACSAMR